MKTQSKISDAMRKQKLKESKQGTPSIARNNQNLGEHGPADTLTSDFQPQN
jgi:hypothetical protein